MYTLMTCRKYCCQSHLTAVVAFWIVVCGRSLCVAVYTLFIFPFCGYFAMCTLSEKLNSWMYMSMHGVHTFAYSISVYVAVYVCLCVSMSVCMGPYVDSMYGCFCVWVCGCCWGWWRGYGRRPRCPRSSLCPHSRPVCWASGPPPLCLVPTHTIKDL